MNYEAAVEKLKFEYKEIFTKENGKPAWAYHKKKLTTTINNAHYSIRWKKLF